MSHPSSDPALAAVAARFGGLIAPDPSRARILEIGCASGHNLLPLAVRWPGADFLGIDIAEDAVKAAGRKAAEAGIPNARFIAEDLRGLRFPGETFDFIIAHGVFSWVDDDAKQALLEFCARHLSVSGIAVISFNLMSGWENRLPVVDAVRRIMAEHDVSVVRGLQILREVAPDDDVRWIVDDMLAKGEEILAFDDFAPVNDPWPLDRFAAACVNHGLRWLGESDPAENIPSSLGEEDRASLMPMVGDPLLMQMTADMLAGSAFRSGVLCRHDAPVEPRMSMAMVLDLCVRLPETTSFSPSEALEGFLEAMKRFGSSCVKVREVIGFMEHPNVPVVARAVFEAITRGGLIGRIEPVEIPRDGSVIRLNRFNALCVREAWPLVDVWHAPCLFSENTLRLLGEIDGKSIEEAEIIAAEICPDLAFPVWLRHLTDRGLVDFE